MHPFTTRTIAASCVLTVAMVAGCESQEPGGQSGQKVSASPTMVSASPANVVVSTDGWTFEETAGVLLTTPHYRIYTTTTRQTLKERLPGFMEMALQQYLTSLGDLPRPTSTMETYLLSNRPQWTRMTQRLMGQDAEIYLKIQRGGFAAEGRAILYEIGPHDTYAIAAHEGWHQFTQKSFKDPLPVWLEEGVACYMEGFRWDSASPGKPLFQPWANFERFDELRGSQREGSLMPLQRVVRSTPQELMAQDQSKALTYYAQLWALVHFLNEGQGGKYAQGLRKLIQDASQGHVSGVLSEFAGARAASQYRSRRQSPHLFEAYFGVSPEAVDAEYQAFIKNITRVGAKQQVAAGVSPYLPEAKP
jgi:hypothetical protein